MLVWLVVTGSEHDSKCTLLTNYQWDMIWGYFDLFESNRNYVLGTGMHEHAWMSGWNQLQEFATSKGIRKCRSVLVKYLGAGPLWDTGTQ